MKQVHVDESSNETKQLLHSRYCDVRIIVHGRMANVRLYKFGNFCTPLIIFFLKYVTNAMKNCKFLLFSLFFKMQCKYFKLISSNKDFQPAVVLCYQAIALVYTSRDTKALYSQYYLCFAVNLLGNVYIYYFQRI